jgi:hypothetical protein
VALTAPRKTLYSPSSGDGSCLDASAPIVDGAREGLTRLWIGEVVDLSDLRFEIKSRDPGDCKTSVRLSCDQKKDTHGSHLCPRRNAFTGFGWLLLVVFPRCSFDGCKVLVDAVHVSRETYLQTKHDFSQLLVGTQSIRVVACPPTRIQNEHEALGHMCAQLVHPGRYSSGGERRGHRGSPWTIREPYRAPPWFDPLRL